MIGADAPVSRVGRMMNSTNKDSARFLTPVLQGTKKALRFLRFRGMFLATALYEKISYQLL